MVEVRGKILFSLVSERNKLLFEYFLLLAIHALEATFCSLLSSVIYFETRHWHTSLNWSYMYTSFLTVKHMHTHTYALAYTPFLFGIKVSALFCSVQFLVDPRSYSVFSFFGISFLFVYFYRQFFDRYLDDIVSVTTPLRNTKKSFMERVLNITPGMSSCILQ